MKVKLFGLSLLIVVVGLIVVGCGQNQAQNQNSTLTEETIIVMGKEISLFSEATVDQMRLLLGTPEATDVGYFFRDDLATDYYDSGNVLVRFSIPHDPQYIPTWEVVSIIVLGGTSKTKSAIRVGDSVEKVFSLLGEKQAVGYKLETTLYLDYGTILYYDPVDNKIKRFTLPSKWGSFD